MYQEFHKKLNISLKKFVFGEKIAFGMHTDSIKNPNGILNEYLTQTFVIANKNFMDPFYKVDL